MCSLRFLDLRQNKLEALPRGIGRLRSLRVLYLDRNQIADKGVPEEFGGMRSLRELSFHHNCLTEAPRGLIDLKQLSKLWLSKNRIRELPDETTTALVSLTHIWIDRNELKSLDPAFGSLKRLRTLQCKANPFRSLPHPKLLANW